MRDPNALIASPDFRDHLANLAGHLSVTTDLGTRPSPGLPAATGTEMIVDRYLSPVAMHYLRELTDIGEPDPSIIGRIAEELDQFCDASHATVVEQIAIGGITPDAALAHRNIELRPLSAAERGAVAEIGFAPLGRRTVTSSDFVVPRTFNNFMPSAALEIVTERPRDLASRPHFTTMPNRVVLALFLLGYDIGTRETITTFERPRWAGFGTLSQLFPVSEGESRESQAIDQKQFEEVVDLAHRIPQFGGEEGNRREVALYRLFRGCAAPRQQSGLLDFAIALEAALLDQSNSELAYKFRLYGALFLQKVRQPSETFEALKSIYEARSKLVHGGTLRPADRKIAEERARDLAGAVMLHAIEHGWPDPAELNKLALAKAESSQ